MLNAFINYINSLHESLIPVEDSSLNNVLIIPVQAIFSKKVQQTC